MKRFFVGVSFSWNASVRAKEMQKCDFCERASLACLGGARWEGALWGMSCCGGDNTSERRFFVVLVPADAPVRRPAAGCADSGGWWCCHAKQAATGPASFEKRPGLRAWLSLTSVR
jgi:hypothetical protein